MRRSSPIVFVVAALAVILASSTADAQAEQRVRGWIPLFERAESNPDLAIDPELRYRRHRAIVVEGKRFDRSIDAPPPPPVARVIAPSTAPADDGPGWLGPLAIGFFFTTLAGWFAVRWRRSG